MLQAHSEVGWAALLITNVSDLKNLTDRLLITMSLSSRKKGALIKISFVNVEENQQVLNSMLTGSDVMSPSGSLHQCHHRPDQ